MSDMNIKDGSGHGYRAKVDSENRLLVSSVSSTFSSHLSAKNASVYTALATPSSLTVTATGGHFFYLENRSDDPLMVSNIIIATDGACNIKIYRNLIAGTLGNYNSLAPINLNFGSSKQAECNFYVWDEVGDGITGLSGGTLVNNVTYGTAGVVSFPFEYSVYLTKGTSITLYVKGVGATREIETWATFAYTSMDF